MGSIHLTWLADELRAGGLEVVEYAGWRTRARSSGGFSSAPVAISWHHTASAGNAQADCDYMVKSSAARPTCNLYIARDGAVWVLAAGATNTSGKGNRMTFSRGVVEQDTANTRTVGIEAGNNGSGMSWPQAQIDAYFATSNIVNRRLGNQPGDVFTHQFYAPTRKVDPATAAAVEGPWRPRSCTSAGTWNVADVRAECCRRAGTAGPPPAPKPPPLPLREGTSMFVAVYAGTVSYLVQVNLDHTFTKSNITGNETYLHLIGQGLLPILDNRDWDGWLETVPEI